MQFEPFAFVASAVTSVVAAVAAALGIVVVVVVGSAIVGRRICLAAFLAPSACLLVRIVWFA